MLNVRRTEKIFENREGCWLVLLRVLNTLTMLPNRLLVSVGWYAVTFLPEYAQFSILPHSQL